MSGGLKWTGYSWPQPVVVRIAHHWPGFHSPERQRQVADLVWDPKETERRPVARVCVASPVVASVSIVYLGPEVKLSHVPMFQCLLGQARDLKVALSNRMLRAGDEGIAQQATQQLKKTPK